MQKTRREILDILKRKGTATLDELAREIGLSAVTIRAHLSVLERDDLVASDEVRGRVGRPHFVYSLTPRAQEQFPVSYHLVAHRFLEAFMTVAGPEQMQRVVQQVADSWAAERAGRVTGRELEQRVAEVVEIRNEEGAMAEWERVDGAILIHQYNCPASQIASGHPEVCQAEQEYLSRLLGRVVERQVETRGMERKCSYRVAI